MYLGKVLYRLIKLAFRAFLWILKILPFVSTCVDKLSKKESSS